MLRAGWPMHAAAAGSQRWRGRGATGQRKSGSRPAFQAQSAFLGASRAIRPEARHTPRRPCGLPYGEESVPPPRRPHPGKLGEVLFSHIIKSFVHLCSGLRADASRRLAYARRCGGQSKVAGSRGNGAAEVWFQTSLPGAKRLPRGFSGHKARSAAYAATPLRAALRGGVGDPSP